MEERAPDPADQFQAVGELIVCTYRVKSIEFMEELQDPLTSCPGLIKEKTKSRRMQNRKNGFSGRSFQIRGKKRKNPAQWRK